jgi:ribosomal protein S18 acetylase RimI-like enzyme
MEDLLVQAVRGGLRSVRLEVVADNQNAIALYQSLGFTTYGREPAAYRLGDREWDLSLMTRDCATQVPWMGANGG